jgi:glutamate formiminotransferase / formiminotetrahydrofolate cyclodeaminase
VPNFSEGRRREVVDALSEVLKSTPGVALLDSAMDPAHNRCVISVAGDPRAVSMAIIAAVGKAMELIDLRQHEGQHPRMGATDVIPFIPISGITMEECIELSAEVAEQIAVQYGIPTYLYEQSARMPERRDLAAIRKGEFEGIRAEIVTDPQRKPDFGPCRVHPSAGVTAVGARHPLIAYNVYLQTEDLKIAQAIAKDVRFATGGLRYVKALGFEIRHRKQVQVSMNLTNFEKTPIFKVFDTIRAQAERHGVAVASSEIVGLAPQSALDACAGHYLKLEGFSRNQILENRLKATLPYDPGIEEFAADVATPEAVPGGGSVAALAGALAAALGEMTAGLTEGKKEYQAVELQARELHVNLANARKRLQELIWTDSAAYQAALDAHRLPNETEQQMAARRQAIEQAMRGATQVPLRTAQAALNVLESLQVLISIGNKSARSDAAAGAHLAFAAIKGCQYATLFNIAGLQDKEFARSCRAEFSDIASKARELIQNIDARMTSP